MFFANFLPCPTVTNNRLHRGRCGAVRSRQRLTARTGHNLPKRSVLDLGKAGTEKPSNRGSDESDPTSSPQNPGRRGRTPHSNHRSERHDTRGCGVHRPAWPRQGREGRAFYMPENAHPQSEEAHTADESGSEGRELRPTQGDATPPAWLTSRNS